MTMKDLKNIASDCGNASRWAEVQCGDGSTKNYRIISLGTKHARLLTGSGNVFQIHPSEILKAW